MSTLNPLFAQILEVVNPKRVMDRHSDSTHSESRDETGDVSDAEHEEHLAKLRLFNLVYAAKQGWVKGDRHAV